jgi:predicted tellurium resistance membrane protein TerC
MDAIAPLLTLILLEVVLGLDNVIFISILASKLPQEMQLRARRTGLILAMIMRLILLAGISIILKLDKTLFTIFNEGFSGKDLILIGGGLFLLYKASTEIYERTEGEEPSGSSKVKAPPSFRAAIGQILLLDLVFSIDSIVTAVGMVDPNQTWIMYVAVVVTVAIMMFAAGPIARFIHRHPSIKVLALSFLLLIGVSLMADGLGFHIPKGYIYFSLVFSMLTTFFQIRAAKDPAPAPVNLRERYSDDEELNADPKG